MQLKFQIIQTKIAREIFFLNTKFKPKKSIFPKIADIFVSNNFSQKCNYCRKIFCKIKIFFFDHVTYLLHFLN